MTKERKGSAVKGNGFDPKQAQIHFDTYERIQEEKVEAHMSYMSKIAKINARAKEALEVAANAGIPAKVIRDRFKIKQMESRIEDIRNPEDEEHAETLQMFCEALGDFADTPLGEAAVEKKKSMAKGAPGADAPADMH